MRSLVGFGLRVLTPALLAGSLEAKVAAAAAPTLEFVFDEKVTLASDVTPGPTPLGRRNIVPITGGTFEGPRIRGTILPGGWDWQLERSDGCLAIRADYMLRTDDGVVINILNQGVVCRPPPGQPPVVRTHPVFEAPIGRYDWLNRAMFVGTLVAGPKTANPPYVEIGIYRVQ